MLAMSMATAWLTVIPVLAGIGSDTAPVPEDAAELHACTPGPWGNLRYYYFFLEAPEHVVAQFPIPNTVTKWVFPVDELGGVGAKLEAAGMPHESVERMLTPARVVNDGRQVSIFPSPDDLQQMSPETRSQVYAELAKHPGNSFHRSPVVFLTDSVRTWAENSNLPERLVALIERFAYRSGEALAFADVPLLISQAESASEARFILQKLTRIRTLMAHLELSADDDLGTLVDYWSTGLGLRRMEIKPLMEAIVRTRGVSHLDLLHLLPPLPRKLLYTYPDMSYAAEGRMPDCHWTSLNFFNVQPQQYLLDSRLATSEVLEDFEKVGPPYRYGDVLMFMDSQGRAGHSATYLADDILFSKNGTNMLSPWLLMRLPDLKKLYNAGPGETRIEAFRHKR